MVFLSLKDFKSNLTIIVLCETKDIKLGFSFKMALEGKRDFSVRRTLIQFYSWVDSSLYSDL